MKKLLTFSLRTHRLSKGLVMLKYSYCEQQQIKRAEKIAERLKEDNLSDWAKNYWKTVIMTLARSQEQLDYRFKNMARNDQS